MTHRDEPRPLDDCQEVIGYTFRDPVFASRGADARIGGQSPAVVQRAARVPGRRDPGRDRLRAPVPEVPGVPGRGADADQVGRRVAADLRQDLRRPGFRRLPVHGQGDGVAGADPVVGPGRRLREPDRRDLPRRRAWRRPGRFIVTHIEPEIDAAVDGQGGLNYKSNLQQVAQRQFGETPTYLLLDEKGPDHSKCFKISAQIGRQRYCSGLGPQQEGGRATGGVNALSQLAGEPIPSNRTDEVAVRGSLVADLGVGPEVWLFLRSWAA